MKLDETFDLSQTNQAYGNRQSVGGSSDDRPSGPKIEVRAEKIEVLAEIICSAGDEFAGALFVLMGTLQHSTHPKVLANAAKHLAFTRCGEFNLFGMVDAQIAVVEDKLFVHGTPVY